MAHIVIPDLAAEVTIKPGSVVSKVIRRDDAVNVTLFGIAGGEGLEEHQTSRPAIIHVLSGHLRLTVDGDSVDAGPGCWLSMMPGTPHALVADEPTLMLLTLLRL